MRYSPDERRAHVELWRDSGLSKAAYCREFGLPYHRLVAWAVDSSAVRTDESEPAFIELDHADAGEPESARPVALLDLGAGRSLSIAATADPVWVGQLLAAVRRC